MTIRRAVTAAVILAFVATPASAWDSAKFEWLTPIVHPTHSYLTEYAIDQIREEYPVLDRYRAILIEGANTELHELPVEGVAYGIDLDAKRREHKGTNAGSDDTKGWWREALAAHAAGNMEQAYFYLGILLHMIEDMGVPAHANGVYHQGTISEFDNFEAMALQRWDPDFGSINRADPGHDSPADYYRVSQDWAAADAPGYQDTNSFPKTWLTASDEEEDLVRARQARTATVVMWALRRAMMAFED